MRNSYEHLAVNRHKYNEQSDCAVISLTAAVGDIYSYKYINEWLIKNGWREPRGGTRSGAHEAFFRAHNIDISFDGYENKFQLAHGLALEHGVKTVAAFENLGLKGKYIVNVNRHILTVVDGKAVDWSSGRRHKIRSVFKVEF